MGVTRKGEKVEEWRMGEGGLQYPQSTPQQQG